MRFLLLQGQGPHTFPNPTDTGKAVGAGAVSSAAPRAALGGCGGVIAGGEGDGICLLCTLHALSRVGKSPHAKNGDLRLHLVSRIDGVSLLGTG